MKLTVRIVIAVLALTCIASSVQAASRIEFILDVSGSMDAMAGKEKKIDAARSAIASTLQSIPDGSVVALRLYGHRVPNKNKAKSCKDSQLVIPFAPINKQQFLSAVNKATPLGQTPIALSLEEAAKDFAEAKDEETAIILVSDGEETCGGDPAEVAKDLIAKGFKVTIHTIGFDVDTATRAQLQEISRITGGQYRDAKDPLVLAESLQQLTQESLVIQKEKSVYGEPIRGGDSYETAVEIVPDELYRLDHHQKKNYFDYFYIDLKGGQQITATIQTGEKGVSIKDGKATENNNPYAGLEIHNRERQKLAHDTIIGSKNSKEEMWVNLGNKDSGRYYILVGNTYDDQNKDNPFKITVVDRFDANSKQDAGEKDSTALTLQPGEYIGYLGPNDRTDMYKFTAEPNASYEIKARGSSNKLTLRMIILDSDGVQLVTANSPNPGATAKVEGFVPPKRGDYYINLSSYYSDVPLTNYMLTLAQAKGAMPPSKIQSALKWPSPLASLSLLEKIKFILMFSGIPLASGLLIGMIFGYFKGRRKRK